MMRESQKRVAVIAGARTPFVKSGKAFKDLGPLRLAAHAVRGLIDRHEVDPTTLDAISFGVVVPEPARPNLAREVVFEADLPRSIEAQTISSYCITGLRTITAVAEGILSGRFAAGIAGGTESLSHSDPSTFKEPTTGLTMGQHQELTTAEWKPPRRKQDEIALASHRRAIAARERLAAEIIPLEWVTQDSGPLAEKSIESLTALAPLIEPNGTITAGNASPVTDGAAAVLLMSEERARAEGRQPLAWIRAMEYAAIDPKEGLLMAPAIAVPRILARTGLTLADIDLIEIHEAFAAQVVCNAMAWEKGWKGKPTGPVNWEKVNVAGSSIALGHPWAATGGRIVTTLAGEMARRGARLGLISICAAGAMAGAMILERD